MMIRIPVVASLIFLAGCAGNGTGGQGRADGALKPLPENVVTLAAPWQNLATARLLPEDDCYWYEHAGPVETTLLPLRTPEGRAICQAAAK